MTAFCIRLTNAVVVRLKKSSKRLISTATSWSNSVVTSAIDGRISSKDNNKVFKYFDFYLYMQGAMYSGHALSDP